MLKLKGFSAVIFDLDGLVLDTESTYYRAWQHAAQHMGHTLPDTFCQQLSGLPHTEVETRLTAYCGQGFDLPVFKTLSSRVWQQQVEQQGIPIKQGVSELLAWLQQQGVPYALATNSSARNARYCLHLAGLAEGFSILISHDAVTQAKPEPDIFWAAARALQTPITRCLALEDSHTGVVAAKRAGAMTVFVPSVLPAEARTLALCDVRCTDLLELLQQLHISNNSHSSPLVHGYRV